jgi:hypothetical protein
MHILHYFFRVHPSGVWLEFPSLSRITLDVGEIELYNNMTGKFRLEPLACSNPLTSNPSGVRRLSTMTRRGWLSFSVMILKK